MSNPRPRRPSICSSCPGLPGRKEFEPGSKPRPSKTGKPSGKQTQSAESIIAPPRSLHDEQKARERHPAPPDRQDREGRRFHSVLAPAPAGRDIVINNRVYREQALDLDRYHGDKDIKNRAGTAQLPGQIEPNDSTDNDSDNDLHILLSRHSQTYQPADSPRRAYARGRLRERESSIAQKANIPKPRETPTFLVDPLSAQDITVHMSLPVKDDLEDRLEESARMQRLGYFNEAMRILQELHERYPDNTYILVQFGQCLVDAGHYSRLDSLARVRKRHLDPNHILEVIWTLLLVRVEIPLLRKESIFPFVQNELPFRLSAEGRKFLTESWSSPGSTEV